MKTISAFLLTAVIILTSCEKTLVGVEANNTPKANFRQLWNDFDRYYGLFDVKQIAWDSMYNVYYPQVHDDMSEQAFYNLLVSMLQPLHDAHVTLYPASSPGLPNWSIDLENGAYVQKDFDLEVVKNQYLSNYKETGPGVVYGWLNEKVAYIHLDHFDGSQKQFEAAMDMVINAVQGAQGLVLDIRSNPGGFDPIAQYVAGRFASQKRLYMTVRKRNGPNKNDFTAPMQWLVEPGGNKQYTRPIVLLTNRSTESAGETFALALCTQPHVIHAGDTTGGALSDNIMREMYNGWAYTISVGDYRDAQGNSPEGIGIIPAVVLQNERIEVVSGKDKALEAAMEMLQ